MHRTLFAALGAWLALATATDGQGAKRHKLSIQGTRFFLEEIGTGNPRPFDVWLSRLANSCFDTRYTDLVIEQLDDYKRYGVNTIVVGIQGGNLQTNKNFLYPKTYNPDGSLDLSSVVWSNLNRILDETDRRGMVVMVQFWYFLRDEQVPTDAAALTCTTNAAKWLAATGHQNLMLDIVNEFTHPAYDGRPLFTTANGALQLIHAAKAELPGVPTGVSPKSGIAAPSGTITVGSQTVPVAADIIIGHNAIADPTNVGSYTIGGMPANPLTIPYINNEFDAQLGGEHYPSTNPRTGRLSYGHFTPSIVNRYLGDLQLLRNSFNGYGNVFTSHQQFVPPNDPIPDPRVGPEGTQPQATAGTAEPSVHWLFSAIAGMRKFGSLETSHDFEGGEASGFLLDGPGTWAINPTFDGKRLEQTDANEALAWTRMVPDAGDVDVAFEAGFVGAPSGTLGLRYGAADPSGTAYRLRIDANSVTLDQVGGPMTPTSVAAPKVLLDQYRFVRRAGRVQVYVNETLTIDAVDNGAVTGHNLLLTTENAAAWFDNLRTGPIRLTDFDLATTGNWQAQNAGAWATVGQAWRATVPSGTEYALLDQVFDDVVFHATVDLSNANDTELLFAVQDPANPGGAAYRATLSAQGAVTWQRVSAAGVPTTLASGTTTINRASVRVRVAIEGTRVRIDVDGNEVVDVTDPSAAPLEPGAIAIAARTGTTVFDDLEVEGGARRYPVVSFSNTSGPAIPAGFTIHFDDPDGLWDLQSIQLEADFGQGYFDVNRALLSPLFPVTLPGDGKGIGFALVGRIDVGTTTVHLRATAIDRGGNRTRAVVRFN